MVGGVNIFRGSLQKEECAEPMVCDSSIKLTKNEIAFLKRGPGFMLRQTPDELDFKVDLGKMIVKERFEEFNKDVGEDGESETTFDGELERLEATAGMIYSKTDKSLDLGKFKATDYKFNNFIHMPNPGKTEKEAAHEIRKREMLKIFKKVVSGGSKMKKNAAGGKGAEHRVESNLSKSELEGLKSLRKRVNNKEIVITQTDKSRRFCVLRYDQYLDSGHKHTNKDMEIEHSHLKAVQRGVNDHCTWLRKIFNIGASWGHEDRFTSSMTDNSEVVAPLYLLVKDHKGWRQEDGVPPPSRPVCSGNRGLNRHLSEMLSNILEPVGHAVGGCDIDSTGGLLSEIEKLNEKLAQCNLDDTPARTLNNGLDVSGAGAAERDGENTKKNNELKEIRIKRLREMKARGSILPNMKSKLWASRLQDEISNNRAILLPSERERKIAVLNEKESDAALKEKCVVINGERNNSIMQPPDEEREERSLAEPESTTWPNGDLIESSNASLPESSKGEHSCNREQISPTDISLPDSSDREQPVGEINLSSSDEYDGSKHTSTPKKKLFKKRMEERMKLFMERRIFDSSVSDSSGPVSESIVSEPPEFDIWSSGTEERVLSIIERAEAELNEDLDWAEESVPSFEGEILGLVSDRQIFNNPFDLTDEVRRKMMLRGEQAAARAQEWNLNSFDNVGGINTLRNIWASLKGAHKVRGIKRSASSWSTSGEEKKLKKDYLACPDSSYSDESLDGLQEEEICVPRVEADLSGAEALEPSLLCLEGRNYDDANGVLAYLSEDGESVSSEMPSLASSESDSDLIWSDTSTAESDSGHSDTWTFTPSVVDVVQRRVQTTSESSKVTVTGPSVRVCAGYSEINIAISDSESSTSEEGSEFDDLHSSYDEGFQDLSNQANARRVDLYLYLSIGVWYIILCWIAWLVLKVIITDREGCGNMLRGGATGGGPRCSLALNSGMEDDGASANGGVFEGEVDERDGGEGGVKENDGPKMHLKHESDEE